MNIQLNTLIYFFIVFSLISCKSLNGSEKISTTVASENEKKSALAAKAFNIKDSSEKGFHHDEIPAVDISHKYQYKVRGKNYKVFSSSKNFQQIGNASWYGPGFHGKKTANGEVYNMHSMTAAHKTLPLGCKVRVRNLSNGKEIIVRINDRGPFHGGRIIDLSKTAAKKLGIIGQGYAKVHIKIID